MNKIVEFSINETPEDIEIVSEIEEKCKNGIPLNKEEIEIILRNLSYIVRKSIAEFEGKNMEEYSYSYKCDLAQSIIFYYLNELNIKSNPVNTNEVINGVCGHSLITTTINTPQREKLYLIDPTYIQFFTKEGCDINKFVIINNKVCIAPDPGFFVVTNNNTNTVMPLLKDGYIELTEEVAKAYGDSFFQTKQGTDPSQIKNNVASGANYIRWFQRFTSKLSKSIEELSKMGLLIGSTKESKHI